MPCAPVTIESLHSECELSLDPACKAIDRQTRLRVLLDKGGESPPFYLCFSDLGGNVELSVTSGQKAVEPNRQIQVDPETERWALVALQRMLDLPGKSSKD